MDDDMDFWNFLHGTGAGCASIVAWEGLRTLLEGGALIASFSVVTLVVVLVVRSHRKHLKRITRRKPGS